MGITIIDMIIETTIFFQLKMTSIRLKIAIAHHIE